MYKIKTKGQGTSLSILRMATKQSKFSVLKKALLLFVFFMGVSCNFEKEDLEDCYGCGKPKTPPTPDLRSLTGIRMKTVFSRGKFYTLVRELSGGSCYDYIVEGTKKTDKKIFGGFLEKIDNKESVVAALTGIMGFYIEDGINGYGNVVEKFYYVSEYQKANSDRGWKKGIYIHYGTYAGSPGISMGGSKITEDIKDIASVKNFEDRSWRTLYNTDVVYTKKKGGQYDLYYSKGMGVSYHIATISSKNIKGFSKTINDSDRYLHVGGHLYKNSYVSGSWQSGSLVNTYKTTTYLPIQNTTFITNHMNTVVMRYDKAYKYCKKGQYVIAETNEITGSYFSVNWSKKPNSVKIEYTDANNFRTVDKLIGKVILGRKYSSPTNFTPYVGIIRTGFKGVRYFDDFFEANYHNYYVEKIWKKGNIFYVTLFNGTAYHYKEITRSSDADLFRDLE